MRFITNSSVSTREKHAQRIKNLLNLPFDIEAEQVVTAAFVTACYLKKRLPVGCSLLVFGLEGIKSELEAFGFKVTSEYNSNDKYAAVVVGMDPNFTYNSITDALKVFKNNPEALLIGCNLDATFVGEGGQMFPGTGSLVKAVSHATGRDPIIMGKPNNYIYSALLDSCPEFDPTKAVFIGDRLDSDIAFANSNGMFSVLVETGVHKRADVKEIIPSIIISNLAELLL